ncbi:MAG: (2Fe-2S)-binding protein [Rhodospirillales bacterium]
MIKMHENRPLAFQAAKGAEPAPPACIEIDGETITVASGSSLASALLLAGRAPWRGSNVSGEPRAPYCMMGACFECVVEIDGVPGRQSCLVAVRPGMKVRTSDGKAGQ